jgi:hypothetical protein
MDSGWGGRISWDRNSTFSGGQIFDHEVEISNNDSISGSALFSWDWNSKKALHIRQFRSHDRSVDLLIKTVKILLWISISWTNWISTSWTNEFRSHEIRPHDHSPYSCKLKKFGKNCFYPFKVTLQIQYLREQLK